MKNDTSIQLVIFSFNRAAQLSSLIESIYNNWNKYNLNINIIYNYSDEKYKKGYEYLISKLSYKNEISFNKEQNVKHYLYTLKELTDFYNLKLLYLCPFLRHTKTTFRKLLLQVLKNSKSEHVMFLTDDSIFIKQVQIESMDLEWINNDPYHNQVSMRHGVETIGNKNIEYRNGGFSWDFSKYSTNDHWGYRFSLDAHIYNREAILKTLSNMSFSNPNTLESSGILHCNKKKLFNNGKCHKNMYILSFPINIVQSTFNNEALNASPEVLNDYFLKGYKLVYPTIEEYSTFQIYPDYVYLIRGNETIKLYIK